MRKVTLFCVLTALLLAGCSSIPENGSMLNQQVSEGVGKNQTEVEKIIKALADVERAILDQEWNTIYVKAENAYMKKHSVSDAASLTQDQRRAIAVNAAKTYYDLLDRISEVEKQLVSKTRANSNAIIGINNEVTKYLLSVEELDAARSNIKTKLSTMAGIDLSNMSGVANNLIGGI